MVGRATPHDDMTTEELEESRRYRMEIEWSPEDEVFVVSFPDAPGVMTHGATWEEAAAQGEDAILTWLTARKDAGRPFPPPSITARCKTALPGVPDYAAGDIRRVRSNLEVSQDVFARALNVSRATVSSWEQGARRPDGASLRLIHIADKHPGILMGWQVASPPPLNLPAGRLSSKSNSKGAQVRRQRRNAGKRVL